jgi:hypothetical protein
MVRGVVTVDVVLTVVVVVTGTVTVRNEMIVVVVILLTTRIVIVFSVVELTCWGVVIVLVLRTVLEGVKAARLRPTDPR